MIEDILIIGSGQALYGWHNDSQRESIDDDLISGFLTALNSFAMTERGEDIKSLKMKESIIIFEKHDNLQQKLVFVVTTKDEKLLELLYAIIHDVMNSFIDQFRDNLDKVFDGDVTAYQQFDSTVEQIFQNYGLDELDDSLKRINHQDQLKAILFLEAKGGNFYYIRANEYLNKEKMSFLIPLLVNSSKLLYENYLNQQLKEIYLNIIENRVLLLKIRKNVIITKISEKPIAFNSQKILELPYFKSDKKSVKKPHKVIEVFKDITLQKDIQQYFLVDMTGKVFFTKFTKTIYNFEDFIPETISFITAAKKASQEIYNRTLLIAVIKGVKTTIIYINFNTFVLVLIDDAKNFNEFNDIQILCYKVYQEIITLL